MHHCGHPNIRRRDNESTKFMVDPRNGHLAIALTYSRTNSNSPIELNAEKILDLCHHMLKAHVYRNHQNAKTLQSTWLCQVADQVQTFVQIYDRELSRRSRGPRIMKVTMEPCKEGIC